MTSSEVVLGNKFRKIYKICLSAESPMLHYLFLYKLLSHLIFQHEINKCQHVLKMQFFFLK